MDARLVRIRNAPWNGAQRVVVAIDYSRYAARGVSQAGRVSIAFGYTSSRLIVQSAFPARFTTAEVVCSERGSVEDLTSKTQVVPVVASARRAR
jgi:hypothetical protein